MMIFFVSILTRAVVQYEIASHLERRVRANSRYISQVEGELVVSDRFEYEDEGYYFLVLSEDGFVNSGRYPDKFPQMEELNARKLRSIKSQGELFYVYDRVGIESPEGTFYVRGVVMNSEISSRYTRVEDAAYLCVIIVAVTVTVVGGLLARKISNPLKRMCQTAEQIGTNLDMSQRVVYEGGFEELSVLARADNRMLEQIERMVRSQEEFTANVAHELRTPVSVILEESRYRVENAGSEEEIRESFQVLQRQAERMKRLITQLLYLSRLEQGRQKLEKEPLDLAEVARAICEEMQEEEGCSVRFRLLLSKAEAPMDLSLVVVALHNLVSNAVKFSQEGQEITLRTGMKEDRVYAEVKDEGPGIKPETQQRLFERFYKEDAARNSEGFGLGLALAMKIAKLHGGTIEVKSEEGRGSAFTLWLAVQSNGNKQ